MNPESYITGFFDFSLGGISPAAKAICQSTVLRVSRFRFFRDISLLFPYINAVIDDAVYYDTPEFIKFNFESCLCALYPRKGAAAPFEGHSQAIDFTNRLIDFLNDIHEKRHRIKPSHKTLRRVNVLDILRILPRDNCRQCGFASCMAFAAALSNQQVSPGRCPRFKEPISTRAVYPILDPDGKIVSTIAIDVDTTGSGFDPQAPPHTRDIGHAEAKRAAKTPTGDPLKTPANQNLPTPLTSREVEVLRLLAHGITNREISKLLHISPHTAKSHVDHIFNKLGANDRTQAAVWATRNQLV